MPYITFSEFPKSEGRQYRAVVRDPVTNVLCAEVDAVLRDEIEISASERAATVKVAQEWEASHLAQPAPVPAPEPDIAGALLAMFAVLGKPVARKLSALYPDFSIALQRGNWTLAREAIDDALADDAIDKTQHGAIHAALDACHIPSE